MTKTWGKLDLEATYLNSAKAMYDKLTTKIILSGEKLTAFPLKTKRKKIKKNYLATSDKIRNLIIEVN